MAHIIADLKEAFRRGNVFIQLIYINVGVFVATTLINIFLLLFNRSADGIFELLHFRLLSPGLSSSPGHCLRICLCMQVSC